ncbi:hypothetical protein BZA70DRAFT_267816 [Myxozyma melibiosi]|uniref:Protein sym1 n=1 Tax=Myxozyma melibiosi TaxID=54550 RepID=A0ABR1F421_9ASCO
MPAPLMQAASARGLVPAALPPAVARLHTTLLTHHLFYVPLLNWAIIGLFLVLIIRLAIIFTDSVAVAPVVMMSVSNVLLYGLSDTMAQTVTTMAENYASSKRSTNLGLYNNEKLPASDGTPFARATSHVFTAAHFPPANFKFDRTIRFAAWGFVLSIFLYKWLELLDAWLPISDDSVIVPVLCRVIVDQLVWTPIALSGFFAFMSFVEGAGVGGLKRKLSTLLVPTLKTNFTIWPAAQIINFRLIPLHYQLPFCSTVGLFWNTFLSLANAQSTEL